MSNNNEHFVHPGGHAFAGSGARLHTLLGSCVSITLWHPTKRLGGMCHFVLPERPRGATSEQPDGRYAAEAFELLRRETQQHGTSITEYQGKMFGGSNMFGDPTKAHEDLVGTRNVQIAMELLIKEKVEIAVAHVGESGSRRLIFDVQSGQVWVKHQLPDGSQLASMQGAS